MSGSRHGNESGKVALVKHFPGVPVLGRIKRILLLSTMCYAPDSAERLLCLNLNVAWEFL